MFSNTAFFSSSVISLITLPGDPTLVVGSPGKVIREVSEEEKKAVFENTKHYQDNWKKYSKSIF